MRPHARRQRPLCAFGQVLLCGWEKLQFGTELSSMSRWQAEDTALFSWPLVLWATDTQAQTAEMQDAMAQGGTGQGHQLVDGQRGNRCRCLRKVQSLGAFACFHSLPVIRAFQTGVGNRS